MRVTWLSVNRNFSNIQNKRPIIDFEARQSVKKVVCRQKTDRGDRLVNERGERQVLAISIETTLLFSEPQVQTAKKTFLHGDPSVDQADCFTLEKLRGRLDRGDLVVGKGNVLERHVERQCLREEVEAVLVRPEHLRSIHKSTERLR